MTDSTPWTDAGGSLLTVIVLVVLLAYALLIEPRWGIRFFSGFRRATRMAPDTRERWFAGLVAMQIGALAVTIALLVALPEVTFMSVGGRWPSMTDGFVVGIVLGGFGGVMVGLAATVVAARRGEAMPLAGDTGVLLPRNGRERGWLVAVSIGAGTSEELLYRGLLPALAVGLGTPVLVALIGQAVVFGIAHRYQGWSGVGATAVLGAVYGGIVVLTGSLLIPVVLHVLTDARLALSPWQERPRTRG